MALHKEDLDNMHCKCGKPSCEETITFHSGCHPRSPTWTSYFGGEVVIRCSACSKVILNVKVAERALPSILEEME